MNLLFRSLFLDKEFLKIDLSLKSKIYFIFLKYVILINNFFVKVTPGQTRTRLYNNNYYYEDKFGIAFLQSVYVDNAFLKKYIRPNATVIDVGANIGQFNFFCKNYLKVRKIYSFEPLKNTFIILKKNTQNKNIYNAAISDKKKIKFFIPETTLMASSLQTESTVAEEIVEGIRLPDLNDILREKSIDLLKIDTEGSELTVLKTSKAILKKVKYLLIESSINRPTDGDIIKLISYIDREMPHAKLLEIGRVYNGKSLDAIDLFFQMN